MARIVLPRPCLMLVTEPMQRGRLTEAVESATAGGVNVVQIRGKIMKRRELVDAAVLLRGCIGDSILLVNGDSGAAVEAGADGVHLPKHGAQVEAVRAVVGADRLIGRSVHSVEAAVRAAEEGADYLVAGTIFASRSHPDTVPAGTGLIRAITAVVGVPVIAIGGVTPENAGDCLAAGASGIAVLGGILHADDARVAARRYWDRLAAFPET